MPKCPICENNREDLITSSFLPKCYQCGVCGGSFVINPEKDVYAEEYFSEKETPSLISRISAPLLNLFYILRVRKIKKLLVGRKTPKVLDYGCGAGKLIENLVKNGFDAIGFEPSEGARNIARKKNQPVFSEIRAINGGYDLIMFWQSLEHIDKPLETIKNIKNYLSENGKILIAVPNVDSFEAHIFKKNWFHYTYPMHRIHFTPKSIKIMLQKAGFSIIKKDFFNPEYTMSGLVQSFLNWFLPKDVLYSVVSHRRLSMSFGRAIFFAFFSVILLLLFSPFLILFFLIELIFKKTGAMVIVAEKNIKI